MVARSCEGLSGQVYNGPDPAQDHTGSADNYIAGVGDANGVTTSDVHDFYWLTSPAVNSAGPGPLIFSYWRWLNSDYLPYMQNAVEVFDGSQWVRLWETGQGPGVADSAWTYQEFDVTPYANVQMRVRFGFMIGSGGVFTVSSWNVDDVKIHAQQGALCCAWPTDCQTDKFPAADCLAGSCVTGECQVDAQCDDAGVCTVDQCTAGSCTHTPIPGCCTVPEDCVDLPGVCYKPLCKDNTCSY